ncbi:CNP1-like family protein [Hydrogenophaga sp.]|uniref:CNP1-like family protein n=1 Tax=Hydrogenophaga sp. TaxID=1904254 RepID=UPI00272006F4|nr:CNP1-like family protein [Hydrogenophaga sp.]MDO9434780.1 CNP1-like family protein [Hydrogenophaga sp.]
MTFAPRRLLPPFAIAIAAIALCLSWGAQAQAADPDAEVWTESQVNPPASFSVDNLQTFELGHTSALTYGIAPETLTVGPDGVVRYVFVARSERGALNVLYQGLRCQTAEVKTYGRWDNRSSWNTDSKDGWQRLASKGFTQPSLVLARSGVCDGKTVNGTPQNILRTLKNGRPNLH